MSYFIVPAIVFVGAAAIALYMSFGLDEKWIPLKLLFLVFGWLGVVSGMSYGYGVLVANNATNATLMPVLAYYKGTLWVTYLLLFFMVIFTIVWIVGLVNNYVQKKKDEKFAVN